MKKATAIAALGVLLCSIAAFQAPAQQLVRDINTVPTSASGQPAPNWTVLGDHFVFLKDDGVHGAEPWVSDGTPAGTALLADINPGSASSAPNCFTVVNGVLYFFANDGTNGNELWRSDGTVAGTHIVADIVTGPADGIVNSLTNNIIPSVNGILYFVASFPSDNELWRSDGTAQGTYKVSDIGPANNLLSNPGNLAASGSRLFFSADDGTHGDELWTSDGTAAGTHQVSDINPGSGSSAPHALIAVQGGILFTADDGSHGPQLWFADNSGQSAHAVSNFSSSLSGPQIDNIIPYGDGAILTALIDFQYWVLKANSGGTTQLVNMGAGSLTTEFQPINGKMFFAFSDGVWITNGTAAGTMQLGASQGLVSSNTSFAGSDAVYFFASVSGSNTQTDLWRSDGTDAGTYRYAALPQPINGGPIAQVQGKVYFAAGLTSATGVEPWVSDGTPAGTHLLADLAPGSTNSWPDSYFAYDTHLYFVASAGPGGGSLPFISDGTAAGTMPLNSQVPAVPTASSSPTSLTALGNLALFFADDGVHGYQPWVSDGTANGTQMLREITPKASATSAVPFYSFGNLAMFAVDDGVHGIEPWITDGTAAGTRLLADINPGANSSNPLSTFNSAAQLNGLIYFYAEGTDGSGLWRTDGTTAGTAEVVNMQLYNSGPDGLGSFQTLNGQILFLHSGPISTPIYGSNISGVLWRTDGTAAGTSQVSQAVIPDPSYGLKVLNGMLYFPGQPVNAPEDHAQLWRSDGTAAGTQQITNFGTADTISNIGYTFATSKAIIFQHCTTSCGLYASDGTTAGTSQISSDDPQTGAVLGTLLFYTVQANNSSALKVTDGTAAGTIELMSYPGNVISVIGAANGLMLIGIYDPILGPSLWTSDGTLAGTSLLSTSPVGGTPLQIGSTVYSYGSSPAYGGELYAFHGTVPSAADDSIRTATNTPVSVPVLANDGSWGVGLNPGSVTLKTLPAHGVASVNSDGSVSYTPASGYSGGLDNFSYTVADMKGQTSLPATVSIIVAQPVGPTPGVAPSGSSSGGSGSSSGSGGNSSSGGGGGGAFGGSALAMLALGALGRRRRAAPADGRPVR